MIVKKASPRSGGRFEYQLTVPGKDLGPVVMGLGEWGMKWARDQMSDDELDVEFLMFDFKRNLDTAHLPGGRTVIKFHFPKLESFARWWIVIDENGGKELCVKNPGF